MAEKGLRINPSLFISESDKYIYISVNNKVYKLKLIETERKKMYELIQIIYKKMKLSDSEYEEYKSYFLILKKLGGIEERVTYKSLDKTLRIRKLEHMDDIETLNKLCELKCLQFGNDEKGLYAYLTENELILSTKEIENGIFLKPNEKQCQLIVEVILKNEQEILDNIYENNYIAIPLFAYVSGVRVLKEEIKDICEVVDYLWFQPWNAEILIDENSYYPSVLVQCELEKKRYEAVGVDINNALFQIYSEYIRNGDS